jgi:hypothetical protein
VVTDKIELLVLFALGKLKVVGFSTAVMLGSAGDTVAVRVAIPTYRVLAPLPLTTVTVLDTFVATLANTFVEGGVNVTEVTFLAAAEAG